MSEVKYYFDRIADEFNGYYSGRRPSFIQEIGYRIFRGPGLRRRFTDTVKIVGDCNGADMLDVGCGPGVYAQHFSKKGARVTAIDISQKMVELAKKNLSETGAKNFKIMQGDFLNINFDSQFDYILAIGVFDYIKRQDIGKYMDKMARLTKGKIIATFPKMFVVQAPIRFILFCLKMQPVYFYTKKIIKNSADKYNLEAVFHNSGPIWTVEFVKK